MDDNHESIKMHLVLSTHTNKADFQSYKLIANLQGHINKKELYC